MSPRYENMAAFRGSRIGIATVPRQRFEITRDALEIQRALLHKPKPFHIHDVIAMVGCVAVALGVIAMGWAGWLP